MTETLRARAYWVTAPDTGELRETRVAAIPAPGHSLVRTTFSGVSVGTERLVGTGRVPASCHGPMACRSMAGSFELPICYGYSLVGTAIAGARSGQRVFVMHPHQDLVEVADDHTLALPATMPDRRGVLIPNTETALNAVWDAELQSGDATVIFGAGSVGLLLALTLRRLGAGPTTVVETDPDRRAFAAGLPFVDDARAPEAVELGSRTVAFHTTGSARGLQDSLAAVGFEGRVLELSWYGDRTVEISLGTDFHYQRKRILSSQVGSLSHTRRSTHDFADRLAAVLDILDDADADLLLSPAVPFAELPALMRRVYRGEVGPHPLPLIAYP